MTFIKKPHQDWELLFLLEKSLCCVSKHNIRDYDCDFYKKCADCLIMKDFGQDKSMLYDESKVNKITFPRKKIIVLTFEIEI